MMSIIQITKQHESCIRRLREDADTNINEKRLDRVVFSGYKPSSSPPQGDFKKMNEWITRQELDACQLINDRITSNDIIYVQALSAVKAPTIVMEVRLADVRAAENIRRQFGINRKQFSRELYVATSITQGTRVRIAIMMAMARKIEGENNSPTHAYCSGKTLCPVVKVEVVLLLLGEPGLARRSLQSQRS
jgi:hypothetical protein